MSGCAKTPWGNLPLREDRDALRVAGAVFRAPRFTDQLGRGPAASQLPGVREPATAPLAQRLGDADRPLTPVRRPPVADVSAPGEGGPPPLDSPGAAHSVLTVTLPDSALLLLRLIGAHDGVEDEGAIITRLVVARAEKIGIAALADASTPVSVEGREGVPSGAFPLPQGPP